MVCVTTPPPSPMPGGTYLIPQERITAIPGKIASKSINKVYSTIYVHFMVGKFVIMYNHVMVIYKIVQSMVKMCARIFMFLFYYGDYIHHEKMWAAFYVFSVFALIIKNSAIC